MRERDGELAITAQQVHDERAHVHDIVVGTATLACTEKASAVVDHEAKDGEDQVPNIAPRSNK